MERLSASWLLLLLALAAIFSNHVTGKETKPPHARALCGDAFVKAWKTLCFIKSGKGGRRKRSIDDAPLLKVNSKILPKAEAQQFLRPLLERTRRDARGLDNADEECCKERCTFAEVAEYAC